MQKPVEVGFTVPMDYFLRSTPLTALHSIHLGYFYRIILCKRV